LEKLLENCFLFQHAPEAAQEAAALPVEVFARDEVLYDAAHFRRALGLVLSGRIEAAAPGERAVLTVFRPGALFGAAALFGGGESYVSRIRAATDSTVVFFPEELLRRWFARQPEMALDYITFLTGRIRFLNGKIAIFTQDSVEHRLYRWLTANCDEEGHLPGGICMTQLAGILSIGRTSLYRALDALEAQQLLTREGKFLEVVQ
jgi:CRP-like cAMP-binding protein